MQRSSTRPSINQCHFRARPNAANCSSGYLVIISEVFGPTLQGEGPSTGRRCAFIRLGRCNLTCAWCDTPYTWDWKGINGTAFDSTKELARVDTGELVDEVSSMDVALVVITGGEPLLQQSELADLCNRLTDVGCGVEVETNGTRTPHPDLCQSVSRFNVSPKLSNSGIPYEKRINLDALRAFSGIPSCFKFVARDAGCLEEISVLQKAIPIVDSAVWVMPEGKSVNQLSKIGRSIVDDVIIRGWNYSTRLHVSLWGDERGR